MLKTIKITDGDITAVVTSDNIFEAIDCNGDVFIHESYLSYSEAIHKLVTFFLDESAALNDKPARVDQYVSELKLV